MAEADAIDLALRPPARAAIRPATGDAAGTSAGATDGRGLSDKAIGVVLDDTDTFAGLSEGTLSRGETTVRRAQVLGRGHVLRSAQPRAPAPSMCAGGP